jgi:hypothetical protein
MKYSILIRDPNDEYGEIAAMQKLNIPFKEYRTQIEENSLVIGRYSVLPFYKELEEDLATKKSRLINSFEQFKYCSDLSNWYQDFSKLNFTPKTWFTLEEYLRDSYEGPVVLKGETNSRRDKWFSHMFANNKKEAREVYCRLLDDGLISQQKIYIRKYEPLKKLADGVTGMPIPNEWRIFVLYGQIISCDFYWSTYLEDIYDLNVQEPSPPPDLFIADMTYFVGGNSNFYSIDVAEKEDGSWTVIELNEGQMSGLNGLDREFFYSKLKEILKL